MNCRSVSREAVTSDLAPAFGKLTRICKRRLIVLSFAIRFIQCIQPFHMTLKKPKVNTNYHYMQINKSISNISGQWDVLPSSFFPVSVLKQLEVGTQFFLHNIQSVYSKVIYTIQGCSLNSLIILHIFSLVFIEIWPFGFYWWPVQVLN